MTACSMGWGRLAVGAGLQGRVTQAAPELRQDGHVFHLLRPLNCLWATAQLLGTSVRPHPPMQAPEGLCPAAASPSGLPGAASRGLHASAGK